MTAADLIASHEGYRQFLYRDTGGNATVGIGFCIEPGVGEGLTRDESIAVLEIKIEKRLGLICGYHWFQGLTEPQQAVILDMTFQLGVKGMLTYANMIAALDRQDFDTAADELLNSDAARQYPERFQQNADILRSGQWPTE